MESQFSPSFTDVAPLPTPRRSLASRIGIWFGAVIGAIAIAVFIASFFLDGILRPRIESSMNGRLTDYHVTLGHAHLQLLTFTLTLSRLIIVQQAHPTPPIAEFPLMRFRIQWKELFSAHLVANVNLSAPRIHIDQAQFRSERNSKTPLRQKGWQDALESVYPFKINRFAISDGDITYIDNPPTRPLHLANVNFVTDNIRNIHEPDKVYSSRFRATMVVFDKGKLTLEGRANYLMKPFPGMITDYVLRDAPLSAVSPASKHVNLAIKGGTLSSDGTLEYSPKVTNVNVHNATIDTVDVTYFHLRQTQNAESRRINTIGQTVEKENNRPTVNIRIRELDVRNSRLAFEDQASDPPYTLFIDGTNIRLENLGNHQVEGPARIHLTGKFMGSGSTKVEGTFLASGEGPEFAMNFAILDTDMRSLNPLLRAHGRFDVARGQLTVYAQLGVTDRRITGYVKPMFSDLKVYEAGKDKNKGLLQQAKEMAIGAAAHVFKNSQTKKVATQIDLSGTLKDPNVSNWRVFVEVVRNAFIKAILPGYDREVQTASAQPRANHGPVEPLIPTRALD